jgi:TetR/AcrR family transcriptional repressor of multidrug resistance operon
MPVPAKPARKTRIRNPRQTRARLLEATAGLLAQKGADGLSIKEAAQVANVSRGVAYQHFRDRDHLLSEAKVWIMERLMESSLEARTASMEENVSNVARLVLSNREAASLFLADALAGRVLAKEHPFNQLLSTMLSEFKKKGEGRAGMDVEVLSCILLGAVASMVMLGTRQAGDDVDDLATRFGREFSLMLREGIFAPSRRGASKSGTS